MGASKYCFVYGCKINNDLIKKDKLSIHFHCLPSDKDRSKIWIELCNPWKNKVVHTAYICSLHFQPECCERDKRNDGIIRTSKCKLIPSLNLPSRIAKSNQTIPKILSTNVSLTPNSLGTKNREFTVCIPCDKFGNVISSTGEDLTSPPKFVLTAQFVVESVITGDRVGVNSISTTSSSHLAKELSVNLETYDLQSLSADHFYTNNFNEIIERQRLQHGKEIQQSLLRDKRLKETFRKKAKELKALKRSHRSREANLDKLKAKLAMPGFRGDVGAKDDHNYRQERKRKWTDSDILKAQCLKSISRQGYLFVREVMAFPMPGYSTLMRGKKDVFPGERDALYETGRQKRKRKRGNEDIDERIPAEDGCFEFDDMNSLSLLSTNHGRLRSKKRSSQGLSIPNTREELRAKIDEFKSKIVPSKYSRFTPLSKKRYTRKELMRKRREQRIKDGTFGKKPTDLDKFNSLMPISVKAEQELDETEVNFENNSLIVLNSDEMDLSAYPYWGMYGNDAIEVVDYDPPQEEAPTVHEFVSSPTHQPLYVVSYMDTPQANVENEQFIIEEIDHQEIIEAGGSEITFPLNQSQLY